MCITEKEKRERGGERGGRKLADRSRNKQQKRRRRRKT
jgi:hypothetical protein